MLKSFLSFAFVLFLAILLWGHAPPALAADGGCVATPPAGPVGTTFALAATGFDPNTPVWLYATEPDGTAFSDPEFNAFGGSAKADESGTVHFTFVTRFTVQGYTINRTLGDWTLVAQELSPGQVVVHEAHCIVTVTGGGEQRLSGAALQVNPTQVTVGADAIVTGTGFAPNEIVNLWLSPPGCSSFAFTLPSVLHQYATASAYSLGGIKANATGQFTYHLPTYSFYNCLGEYIISAYALGSGAGGTTTFLLVGHGVPGGATLTVNKASGFSRGDTFIFSGSGYTPNGVASCWTTRPEGTVRFISNFNTNSAGVFSFAFTTGFDLEGDFDGDGIVEHMHYSEGSLGTYFMTCRDNVTGATGESSFTLNGLVSDP